MPERDESRDRYPHVTTILKNCGLIDTKWLSTFGRERGSAVHLACQLDDEGDLYEQSLDEAIVPYLQAYRKFKSEKMPKIMASELLVESQVYGFCGTLDRVALMDDHVCVIDLKGGGHFPSDGPQLAAYQVAYEESTGTSVCRRFNLYLMPSGGYRLVHRADRNDWKVFLSALNIETFKRANPQA